MGHIVRRATPSAPPREPLPTTKISELRLDSLVRETLPAADADDGMSTIAMPPLQRPDGHVVLHTHENSAPTRQLAAQPDLDAVTVTAPALADEPPPPAIGSSPAIDLPSPRAAIYPVAPAGTGARLPQVLLSVLVLTLGWLAASLIYAIR